MPSSHLILCCPLLLLPPIRHSIGVFSNESTLLMRWPKYWSFSFSISPSNEHPGLIFFKMDWLNLLAVQGTLRSLLQHHSWKASIFRCSTFFTVQLSHPYMTTGKIIALTSQTTYKLNKQGDSIQSWHTPFLIWKQSVVPCPVLTVASWPAYVFLRRQVRWQLFTSLLEFSTVYCDPHSQRLWRCQ